MTSGEKMIWAAAFVPHKDREIGLFEAWKAVFAARGLARIHGDDEHVASPLLREMLAPDADPLAEVREHVATCPGVDEPFDEMARVVPCAWFDRLRKLAGA